MTEMHLPKLPKTTTLTYYRALISDILDSDAPDPVILPAVNQETVQLMGHHSRELLQLWGSHNQWWERHLLVLTKLGQDTEKLRKTQLQKKGKQKEKKVYPHLPKRLSARRKFRER